MFATVPNNVPRRAQASIMTSLRLQLFVHNYYLSWRKIKFRCLLFSYPLNNEEISFRKHFNRERNGECFGAEKTWRTNKNERILILFVSHYTVFMVELLPIYLFIYFLLSTWTFPPFFLFIRVSLHAFLVFLYLKLCRRPKLLIEK